MYRAVDNRGRTVDFYLSTRRNSKAAYRFLGKILNNVKTWQIPRFINTDKAPTYGRALALLKREGRCPYEVEHRQIKYRNNVIESAPGKLKRIIGATLGFKSMKTAYSTIRGIEVMRSSAFTAMELIAVPTEKGFDTLNLHWGAGRFNLVFQVFNS